ncbi:MAG TPA: hypothetical protein PKA04_06760, partial [Marmoricola sp.]|nr:hypothetical protein [Marmoricola sp.]
RDHALDPVALAQAPEASGEGRRRAEAAKAEVAAVSLHRWLSQQPTPWARKPRDPVPSETPP